MLACVAQDPSQDFEAVAKILVQSCIECHNDGDREGGLSLQSPKDLVEGSDSGALIDAKSWDASLLWHSLEGTHGQTRMPKDREALSQERMEILKRWIQKGTPWPEQQRLELPSQNRHWWSLLPMQRGPIPQSSSWAQHWIDAYIEQGHQQKSLRANPAADKATLIRRLAIDLTGLPPTFEEIQEFVSDERPDAYDRLVDRYIASPRYGERWARHWMDVVHYGETHGYDKDKPRPNAWPYRDYCIRAFNRDLPYRQFLSEQLAADQLDPSLQPSIEALGFLAAGPWDFIGHAEVPESKIDGKIARHLDRDDFVQNTMVTFQSLTVGCAQCHNHKFDPITQEDYYSLQAVFAAIDRTDVEYYSDPQLQSQWNRLRQEKVHIQSQIAALQPAIEQQGGESLKTIEKQIAETKNQKRSHPPEHGYHSQIETKDDIEKWVQVDLGTEVAITKLEWVACYDDFNKIGPGFGYPRSFRIEGSLEANLASPVRLVEQRDVPNPGCVPQIQAIPSTKVRYLRFTATKLAPRSQDFIFALSELKALDDQGNNVALKANVTSLDTIEAMPRWSRSNLVDGIHPIEPASTRSIESLEQAKELLLREKVDPSQWAKWKSLQKAFEQVDQALRSMPPRSKVYAGAIHTGSGAFAGTGSRMGEPRPIAVLARGDVKRPTQIVSPRSLQCLEALSHHFPVDREWSDGARRLALAQWLSDPNNPLTWRSMVNRLWQFHFGTGIVATSNDFGRMGALPTHPALLDDLAIDLRDSGQSLKRIQRMIVQTATYQQSSQHQPALATIDPDNAFLWRMNRRRLDAESIRDALLLVAGQLDLAMGGPSFQDFVVEHPEHSPHYEYHLHDPADLKSKRRSVYRMIVRSQTQPFMTSLDCADPSMQVDRRNESNSALQALTLLNDRLTTHLASELAKQASDRHRDLEDSAPIAWMFRQVLAREPTHEELLTLKAYADDFGLAQTGRLLMNLNEFMFVD